MSGQLLCLKNGTAAGHQDDTMQTAQDIITTYSRTGARLREVFFQERTPLLQKAALRQLEALARPGDALLTFLPDTAQTAMGPVLALAQETGMSCITLCGRPVAGLSLPGLVIDVPDASGAPASLVHELLFAAGHLVCRLVDYYLFENVTAIQTVDPQ